MLIALSFEKCWLAGLCESHGASLVLDSVACGGIKREAKRQRMKAFQMHQRILGLVLPPPVESLTLKSSEQAIDMRVDVGGTLWRSQIGRAHV